MKLLKHDSPSTLRTLWATGFVEKWSFKPRNFGHTEGVHRVQILFGNPVAIFLATCGAKVWERNVLR